MASVPNTNIFPATPKAGAPATGEGEGGEFFASLLPPPAQSIVVGPGLPASLIAQLPPAELRAAGEGGSEEGETSDDGDKDGDDAIAALFAQAEFVPVVQPQTPPPAAGLVTTPVPTVPEAIVAATPALAPAPEGKPIPVQPPLPTVAAAPAPMPVPTAQNEQAPAPQKIADAATTTESPAVDEVVQIATKLIAAAKPKGEAPAKAVRAASPDRVRPATAEAAPEVRITAPAPAQVPATDAPAPAEKASAPIVATVQPAAPLPTATAPLATPAELLATTPAAPGERAAASQPQPADQAIERDLDLAHDGEWLDRLARDIASAGASDGPLRFRLHPQTLGHMRVELTQTEQGTNIRLTVETEAARAIVADAQPRLAAEARAQGVRIGQTEIDLAGNGHQAAGGDPRRQEEARQTTLIRTARGAEAEAVASVETARPNRSDRYA